MKIENSYLSFIWFVAKLVFFVVLLIWLTPLLASMIASTFKTNTISVGDFILFITAAFVIAYTYETQKQAKATEKMAENLIMPAVDVNMIYDQGQKKVYFWFRNHSNIPAFVSLFRGIKKGKFINILPKSLRINPQEPHKATRADYDLGFSSGPSAEEKITVKSVIECAFDDCDNIKYSFKKSYTFRDGKWDEDSWGYPDRSFLIEQK